MFLPPALYTYSVMDNTSGYEPLNSSSSLDGCAMKRIPMNTGDEYDALTKWKRFIRWKSGQRHRIKKQYNRRERMETKRLVRNVCKCNVCGDVIESKSVHDFVQCRCGRIFTDGGTEYVRRGCESPSDIVDLSEYESNAEALIRTDKETYNIESGRL